MIKTKTVYVMECDSCGDPDDEVDDQDPREGGTQ